MRFLFTERPARGRRAAIFLDRDGVINERIVGGYLTEWEGFRFLAGIPQALGALSRLRLPIIVVSNQAGVGKRLVRPSALGKITERFVNLLGASGARIDAVYYCPHTPNDGCRCRKPLPGLLLRAARDWRLNLRASVMVGDGAHDMEAAQAAGCRGILLEAGGATPSAAQGSLPAPGAFVSLTRVRDLPSQVAALLDRFLPGDGPGDHEPA
jgi:D-glycero-D-manno-heptose 1,7-bisphosphate phosphatase